MDETGRIHQQPDLAAMRRDLFSSSISDQRTRETIREVWNKYGLLLEAHGAVAWRGFQDWLDFEKAESGKRKAEIRRAVFLDRDGVINRALTRDNKPYPPTTIAQFEILPGVPEACAKLKAAGFFLIVATNQPDVGRGTLKQEVVEEIHRFMCGRLPIDRVEVCYHPGQGLSDCECRKPKPGLLRRAADDLGIDLAQSWMVGDRWRDIDCGHAAGCRTVFIDYHYAEALRQPPDFRVSNLLEAADLIVSRKAD
jgi:D-glycero-D-manno-heptose 1,7-bisphosphate phosphatase